MNDSSSVFPVPEFKNRRTGLIVVGIFEILLGCLCALLLPLMLLGQAMSARVTGGAPDFRMLVPGMLMYCLLAVAFIWLGIGSMRCRRWARALGLILSWSWLAVGVIALAFTIPFFPKMTASVPSNELSVIVLLFTLGFLTIMFVIVPGVLVIFYQSKDVKATCEAQDPVVRWTDECPLPALAVTLWLAFGAVTMLAMPIAYHAVLPFFGRLLTGVPGALAFLLFAALWVYLAWGWYRLKPIAWWLTLTVLLVMSVSNVLTFLRVDLMEMYRLMGYPPEQIALIEQYSFMTGTTMMWWSAGFMLPLIGYLVWVKRFFGRPV